jgi:peptidoglycan/LPS O-acetylase OafA/YrhL
LVFLGHAGAWWIPGGFGVTVFFFLSGYLITTLMRLEHERTGRIDLKFFYLRRALRIWPPFYIVIASGLLLVWAGVIAASLQWQSVLALALHVYNYWVIVRDWRGVVPGMGVYWSLAVEEHFYLMFPALFIAVQRARLTPKQTLALFAAICAAILAWRCTVYFVWHPLVARTFCATDTRIDSILFGCALAIWRNPALDYARSERPAPRDLAFLAAGVAALLLTFVVRADWFRETLRYTVQGLGLLPLFVTAVRFPGWGPMRVLNIKQLGFVGTLSYSLYLVHHSVLDAIEVAHPSVAWPIRALFALAISFAIAYLLWRFVEEPCAKLRRKLTRDTAKAPATTKAAA